MGAERRRRGARAGRSSNSFAASVEHCGPVGAGASMKLAINLPLMVCWQALRRSACHCARCRLRADAADRPVRREHRAANNGLKMRADMIVAMMERRRSRPDHLQHRQCASRTCGRCSPTGTARGIATAARSSARSPASRRPSSNGLGAGDGSRHLGLLGEPRRETEVLHRATFGAIMSHYACASLDHRRCRARRKRARRNLRAAHRRRARCRRPSRRLQARGQIRHPAFRHRLRQSLGRARHGLRLAHAREPRGARRRNSSPCWRPRAAAAWSPIRAAC